jgi:hypothetical protein
MAEATIFCQFLLIQFFGVAQTRVARWFVFKQKIPISVIFLECKMLAYFMALWSLLRPSGI